MTVRMRGNVRPRIPAFCQLSLLPTYPRSVIAVAERRTELTKSVVDADDPSHTLLTLNGGEDLGRVLERDGTFSQGAASQRDARWI